MRRINLALIAITAGLGFSTAAVAGDAPASAAGASNGNGTVQTATGQRATPRKAVRKFRRAGTSTAGAHGFLPGVTFLSAVFAGTSVAATASSGFDFSTPSPPASPE